MTRVSDVRHPRPPQPGRRLKTKAGQDPVLPGPVGLLSAIGRVCRPSQGTASPPTFIGEPKPRSALSSPTR